MLDPNRQQNKKFPDFSKCTGTKHTFSRKSDTNRFWIVSSAQNVDFCLCHPLLPRLIINQFGVRSSQKSEDNWKENEGNPFSILKSCTKIDLVHFDEGPKNKVMKGAYLFKNAQAQKSN